MSRYRTGTTEFDGYAGYEYQYTINSYVKVKVEPNHRCLLCGCYMTWRQNKYHGEIQKFCKLVCYDCSRKTWRKLTRQK